MKKNLILSAFVALFIAFAACGNSPRPTGEGENRRNEFLSVAITAETDVQTSGKKAAVRMYELPARLTDRPEQILKRQGFTISYNATTKTPNWVAWHLTKSHTYGKARRNEQLFEEDPSVRAPRATLNDYYNSRYDRGHMCPAGDNKWSTEAMNQSFLLTNICPQNHGLNKDAWNDLEILCRTWAREYGAVDVVCGPIYRNATLRNGQMTASSSQRYIGQNRVWVPDAFFKVVLCRSQSPKAIGFIYENRGGRQEMANCVRTVDEVERLTGINFFPELDDKTENRIEAEAKLSQW